MPGPWEKYAAPGAAPVAAPGPVYGPPPVVDPYKAEDQQMQRNADARAAATADRTAANDAVRLQMEQERLRLAQSADARAAAKAGKGADDPSTAIDKLRNVITKIDQVAIDSADNAGWFETGFTGAAARNIPGTAGFDLAENVKTIDANAAFNALAEMRANSPTGGALGQVTERELDLLKSSVANLNTAQSQQQFLANLAEAKNVYLRMLERLQPNAREEYQNAPGIRFGADGVPFLTTRQGSADDQREADPFGVRGGGGPSGNGGGGGGGTPPAPTGGNPLAAGFGDIVEGAGDVLGIISNPLNATVNAALGTNLTTDMGGYLRDAAGLPRGNPTIGAINQGGVAALTGSLAGRGAAQLANPGALQNALALFGAQPGRDAVAGAAAGLGSEVARRNEAGPVGQLGGALVGGLIGYGGANALANALSPRAPNALAQAAARQGVDMLPADAGGPVSKIVTSATRVSPISATPVARAAERSQGQMRSAVNRAASREGDIVPTDQAGEAVSAAGKRWSAKTRDIGNTLYRQAYKETAGLQIRSPRAAQAIDRYLSKLREAPQTNQAAISELLKLRGDLQGGMTVQGLHDLRSTISSGVFDGKLRSGVEKGRMKDIRAALSDDMFETLKGYGLTRAASMLKRADQYWERRVEHIDQVLEPIIGKEKGGEQVVQAIEGMARGQQGGNKRLARLIKEMTREEAGQVRATIVDRIGKATPGTQTAEGNAFSAGTFLTNWNRMTPQAKATVFSNTELRRDLNDIALLAERMKSSQAMANHSNTSVAMQGSAGLQAGWAVSHFPSYVLGAGTQFITGRLMSSPGFARWLARLPENPERARRPIEQLGVLATREPLIASDAKSLQQFLQSTLGQSPGRASASEEVSDRRRKPPN